MAFPFVFFLVAVVVVVSAKDFDLKFEEKGDIYTQKIKIDENNGIVETDVPDHAGVESGKYLTDFNLRLTVMKLKNIKKCYALSIPDDEYTPYEIEAGLKKVQNKFPANKYWVENVNILPVSEIEASSLSKAINDFCGSYPVLKVIKANEKDMEKVALAAAKVSKAGRSKRYKGDRKVTEFIACDNASQFTIARCPGDKLIITCKFVARKTCVFKVGCSLKSDGWLCPGVHSFTLLHCCDYACKK